ncbi:MAG TPA: hypothetical protein VEK38_03870 [Candidatus Bathyarchaeia archaeon]|nr:hypothetical protein [Candidatus Bathyarchaeia archaeon]
MKKIYGASIASFFFVFPLNSMFLTALKKTYSQGIACVGKKLVLRPYPQQKQNFCDVKKDGSEQRMEKNMQELLEHSKNISRNLQSIDYTLYFGAMCGVAGLMGYMFFDSTDFELKKIQKTLEKIAAKK